MSTLGGTGTNKQDFASLLVPGYAVLTGSKRAKQLSTAAKSLVQYLCCACVVAEYIAVYPGVVLPYTEMDTENYNSAKPISSNH